MSLVLAERVGEAHFHFAGNRQLRVPVSEIGGLPIAVIDRAQSARLMVDLALNRRDTPLPPLVVTSANGEVLSLCARHPAVRNLFLQSDLIHADGMSMVFASRILCNMALPERVATTDFFHDVARVGQRHGARMFLLGATQTVIDTATRRVQALYPELKIVGHAMGYMRRRGDEARVVDAINAAKPDILWVGLGVPLEQQFAIRNRDRLRNVGLIKTGGGLFDFLSGRTRRAPAWMRRAGMEWAYRIYLEPRRLALRYLTTNPHALYLLLSRTKE